MTPNQGSKLASPLSDSQTESLRKFWYLQRKYWGEDDSDRNQCREILSGWYDILLNRAEENSNGIYDDVKFEFENECQQAIQVLDDLKWALNHYNHRDGDGDGDGDEEFNKGIIWNNPESTAVNDQPEAWKRCSPVSEQMLDEAVAQYLKMTWLQNDFLDWAIINAALFNQVAEINHGLKSGQLTDKFNLAFLIAGNKKEPLFLWQAGLSIVGFLLRWVIPPAVALICLTFEYKQAAIVIGGAWAIYIIARLIGLATGFETRKLRRIATNDYAVLKAALGGIWLFTSSAVINPTRLRELLSEIDGLKASYAVPAIIYSVTDRAIERDPAVLTK